MLPEVAPLSRVLFGLSPGFGGVSGLRSWDSCYLLLQGIAYSRLYDMRLRFSNESTLGGKGVMITTVLMGQDILLTSGAMDDDG